VGGACCEDLEGIAEERGGDCEDRVGGGMEGGGGKVDLVGGGAEGGGGRDVGVDEPDDGGEDLRDWPVCTGECCVT
jgi:hypothetical protein